MPKPMYVWSGTAWVSVASEVESLANFATQSYADNQPGMKMVVPSSVAVGSGSGSIATQGTITFSGASSVSLNNCFSSTYDNYRILIKFTEFSANNSLLARMRVSGVDATTGNYNYGRTYVRSTGATGVSGGNLQTSFNLNDNATAQANDSELSFDILSPFLAERTSILWQATGNDATSWLSWVGSGSHRVSTSYDGITFYPGSGTMTGVARIYGYKNG